MNIKFLESFGLTGQGNRTQVSRLVTTTLTRLCVRIRFKLRRNTVQQIPATVY